MHFLLNGVFNQKWSVGRINAVPSDMSMCNWKEMSDGVPYPTYRASFSVRYLSSPTIRTPRLTFVSEGKPRRRLLVRSKAVFGIFISRRHDTPPCDNWGG